MAKPRFTITRITINQQNMASILLLTLVVFVLAYVLHSLHQYHNH